jgi:ABC-type nitrate/sulfonate/bicarbonate transport system substrate-binding protein
VNRLTAITTTLAGVAAVAARPLGAQGLPQIRTVATALDQSAALYYAHDLGMFTKHGLDVSITTPNDNALAVPSVVSNSVDIAYTNILAIEQAYKKGLPITLIAPAAVNDSRYPNNYLLVPKKSPIKTPVDLQGKTLGTSPLKNLGDTCTDAWVQQHGGDGSKVKWVEIPYIECGEAMDSGRIDGAFIVEPYATRLRGSTRLLGRPYEAIGDRFLGAGYITSKQWATDHPDLVVRFVAAIREASVWGNANKAKSAVILEKYSKVDADTLAHMTRSVYAETLVPSEVQLTIDFAAKYKFLDAAFPAGDLIWKA